MRYDWVILAAQPEPNRLIAAVMACLIVVVFAGLIGSQLNFRKAATESLLVCIAFLVIVALVGKFLVLPVLAAELRNFLQ